MSYSIGVRAATKALALAALAVKFDETVTASQPVHKHDRDQALAAAESFVAILPDDETKDVSISLNGYVSWSGYGEDGYPGREHLVSASVSVSASLLAREG